MIRVTSQCWGLLWLAALFIAYVVPTRAQVTVGDWVKDANTGCKAWNAHPQEGEAVQWTGACVDGYADGVGSLFWLRNGKVEEADQGIWHRGRQNGPAHQLWTAGRYDGEVKDGVPNGSGVMLLGTSRYEGDFSNGRASGKGKMTVGEKVFAGTWREGCLTDGKQKASFGVPLASCR